MECRETPHFYYLRSPQAGDPSCASINLSRIYATERVECRLIRRRFPNECWNAVLSGIRPAGASAVPIGDAPMTNVGGYSNPPDPVQIVGPRAPPDRGKPERPCGDAYGDATSSGRTLPVGSAIRWAGSGNGLAEADDSGAARCGRSRGVEQACSAPIGDRPCVVQRPRDLRRRRCAIRSFGAATRFWRRR